MAPRNMIVKKKEDRISSLPDDLIHKILKCSEAKLIVRTSEISKRWKLIWTTHPFLKLGGKSIKFVEKFLSKRNNASEIIKLDLSFGHLPPTNLVDKFISYALSHKVQVLSIDRLGRSNIKFSILDSAFVKELELTMNFDGLLKLSSRWNLPALTSLRLGQRPHGKSYMLLPESYLICLPSLQTLSLDSFELPESLFSLPALKTLSLRNCTLPTQVWDLPALLTLKLDNVEFPEETSEFFSAFVNLQDLFLIFKTRIEDDWVIDCPQLENLDISAQISDDSHSGSIIVLSRKIRNFSSVGLFPITFEVSELKHVNIKLWDSTKNRTTETYYSQVTRMFSGLGSARRPRTLTLDLKTIEVLSSVSDYFVRPPPPFSNLKFVRIPPEYKESSMSTSLKYYLLGHSPEATIVTTFPKKMKPQTAAASITDQDVVIEEALAAPVAVQEEHVVQNSEVHADRVRHVGALVEGQCNDQVSSSKENSSFGLWRGLEVNLEFVCLLDQIMSKYPRTFEHLTTKNKKFYIMKLNMLCTTVIDFTKIPLAEVDTEMIDGYKDVFADLQKLGFNVRWLVNRLNYIEHLRFSQPFGTTSTNLTVGYLGDDLLSGP